MNSLTHDQKRDIKTLLIIITSLTVISLMSSCQTKGTVKNPVHYQLDGNPVSDSVTYDMYRGYRVIGGDITPVYIPVKDSVFHATDTIRVNSFGTYDPNGTFRVVVGIYMGHVKFAKEE